MTKHNNLFPLRPFLSQKQPSRRFFLGPAQLLRAYKLSRVWLRARVQKNTQGNDARPALGLFSPQRSKRRAV